MPTDSAPQFFYFVDDHHNGNAKRKSSTSRGKLRKQKRNGENSLNRTNSNRKRGKGKRQLSIDSTKATRRKWWQWFLCSCTSEAQRDIVRDNENRSAPIDLNKSQISLDGDGESSSHPKSSTDDLQNEDDDNSEIFQQLEDAGQVNIDGSSVFGAHGLNSRNTSSYNAFGFIEEASMSQSRNVSIYRLASDDSGATPKLDCSTDTEHVVTAAPTSLVVAATTIEQLMSPASSQDVTTPNSRGHSKISRSEGKSVSFENMDNVAEPTINEEQVLESLTNFVSENVESPHSPISPSSVIVEEHPSEYIETPKDLKRRLPLTTKSYSGYSNRSNPSPAVSFRSPPSYDCESGDSDTGSQSITLSIQSSVFDASMAPSRQITPTHSAAAGASSFFRTGSFLDNPSPNMSRVGSILISPPQSFYGSGSNWTAAQSVSVPPRSSTVPVSSGASVVSSASMEQAIQASLEEERSRREQEIAYRRAIEQAMQESLVENGVSTRDHYNMMQHRMRLEQQRRIQLLQAMARQYDDIAGAEEADGPTRGENSDTSINSETIVVGLDHEPSVYTAAYYR